MTSRTQGDVDAVRKEIAAIGDLWTEAERKKDLEFVRQTLADDFCFTSTKGHLISKAEWLERLPEVVITRFERSEIEVRVFGETSVLTGKVNLESSSPGSSVSGIYRYADIFVKRDGKWQVAYSHFTSIQQ